jgi:hypothetical protein
MEQQNTNPIKEKANGIMNLYSLEKTRAWELAMDVVDFPVQIVPLHYEDKGEYPLAKGSTNTNRDVQFFGVVVDRNRTGDKQVIATVTDSYHTINNAKVYKDLMNDLDGANVENHPEKVYVSSNGGRQSLLVKLPKMATPVLSVGKFSMSISLVTSVDGTLKHSISVNPLDESGRTVFGMESSFSFSSKHTKNLKERHVAFSAVIDKMLSEWNEVIAPMLTLMDGTELKANEALLLTQEILESSKIPEKHVKKMVEEFDDYRQTHTPLSVLHDITSYIDDTLAENRPERVEQFKKALNKTAMKIIKNKLKK